MNLCIPVEEDRGLDSSVCAHFGSAPAFLLVDTETRACTSIVNTNAHHAHGMCQPLAVLAGHPVEAMVVGGIGMGALYRLRAGGIEVYLAEYPTVGETVQAFAEGRLAPVPADRACAGHHH